MKTRGEMMEEDPKRIHPNRGMVDCPEKSILRELQQSRFLGSNKSRRVISYSSDEI